VNDGDRWQPFVKAKAPRAPQPPDVVLWTITARNITSAELRFQGQDGYLPFEIGIVREGRVSSRYGQAETWAGVRVERRKFRRLTHRRGFGTTCQAVGLDVVRSNHKFLHRSATKRRLLGL